MPEDDSLHQALDAIGARDQVPAHDLPGLERDGRPFRVHDDDGRVQTEGHVRDGEVEKGPVEVRTMDVVVR